MKELKGFIIVSLSSSLRIYVSIDKIMFFGYSDKEYSTISFKDEEFFNVLETTEQIVQLIENNRKL